MQETILKIGRQYPSHPVWYGRKQPQKRTTKTENPHYGNISVIKKIPANVA
jgi:hypothetical protein